MTDANPGPGLALAPRLAVVLDENTSQDATRYEAPKSLFRALGKAGGLPLALPYVPEAAADIVETFDGLVSPGGRFAFPPAWYGDNPASLAKPSERSGFERDLVLRFLDAGKPVLGICNGMQILAGLHGAHLTGQVTALSPDILPHNGSDLTHEVRILEGTRLAAITGGGTFTVNTLHNEAVVDVPEGVVVSALAPDGVIEAVELPGYPFAIGVQWHQESFEAEDHPGNALFAAFVNAARAARRL